MAFIRKHIGSDKGVAVSGLGMLSAVVLLSLSAAFNAVPMLVASVVVAGLAAMVKIATARHK